MEQQQDYCYLQFTVEYLKAIIKDIEHYIDSL